MSSHSSSSAFDEDILNFCAAVNINDQSIAKRYLLMSQGDLITAINTYLANVNENDLNLDNNTPVISNFSSIQNSSIQNLSSRPALSNITTDTTNRTNFYPRSYFNWIVNLPISVAIYNSYSWSIRKLWDYTPSKIKTYLHSETVSLAHRYDHLFSSNHPIFFSGTYSQAASEAFHLNRLLLVYLHSPMHEDTFRFCSNTLTDRSLINFINTRLVMWVGDITQPDPYLLSTIINPLSFPFSCLLTCKENNQLILVNKLEGFNDHTSYMQWLKSTLENEDARLAHSLVQSLERNQDRDLRDQQNAEYEEAMRADLARERELEERSRAAEREILEQQELKNRQNALMEADKLRLEDEEKLLKLQKEQLLKELGFEPELGTKNSVALQIRLPDGKQINRRFMENNLVQAIYDFISAQELFAPGGEKLITKWEIVTNYPKRVISDMNKTLGEVDLKGRAVLFVQEI